MRDHGDGRRRALGSEELLNQQTGGPRCELKGLCGPPFGRSRAFAVAHIGASSWRGAAVTKRYARHPKGYVRLPEGYVPPPKGFVPLPNEYVPPPKGYVRLPKGLVLP